MSSPDIPPPYDTESALLRSDLEDIFKTHAGIITIQQTEDLMQPAETLLAGTCRFVDSGGKHQVCVMHARHRIDDRGDDYLVIAGRPGYFSWYQFNDAQTRSFDTCKSVSPEESAALRWLMRTEITTWSEKDVHQWTAIDRPYDTAERIAQQWA